MPCYYPIHGFKTQSGKFTTVPSRFTVEPMTVPCQGCVGCRMKRAGEWAIRGSHEKSLYTDNCFITLTFDKLRLPYRPPTMPPADISLYYPDFQGFMWRLRNKYGADIRMIVSGEYGDDNLRPHFHAILFNFDFPDKYKWYMSRQGHQVYRSDSLEELWPFGFSEIGSVTHQSIGYVARYILKKVNGGMASKHYEWIDPATGLKYARTPEFAHYSLKPGIGYGWFMKYWQDVYPHDYVVFNGRKYRPPRYYDKLYQRLTGEAVSRPVFFDDPDGIHGFEEVLVSEDFDALKKTRIESLQKHLDDNTPSRLQVKHTLSIARLSRLKRKI